MIRIEIEGIEDLRLTMALWPEKFKRGLAKGLNRTAEAIEQVALVEMERAIDRPTPFSLNAIQIYRAQETRSNPSALLQIRPLQARYLKYAVAGGTLPTIVEPISISLNQHGNILGKAKGLQGIADRGRRRFVATINGKLGVWERNGRNLKLLVQVSKNRRREKRWDFLAIGRGVADQRLTRDVREAIIDELRS